VVAVVLVLVLPMWGYPAMQPEFLRCSALVMARRGRCCGRGCECARGVGRWQP
jgi:hypothetical protein